MKKLIALLLALACSTVHASDIYLQPYFGGEVHYKIFDKTKNKKSFRNHHGVQPQILFGLKFTENVGMEVGAGIYESISKNKATFSCLNHHLSLMGYWPAVIDYFEFIGGIGLSHNNVSAYTNGSIESSKVHFENQYHLNPRLMVGFQIPLMEHCKFRTSVIWENTFRKKIHHLDKNNSFQVGAGLVLEF